MSIIDLWLPILVSAAIVWIASAIVWMVMPWHKTDFKPTKDEEAVRGALKGAEPGYYMVPYCMDPEEYKKPELQQKYIDGPVAYITVVPNGLAKMGMKMFLSFVFYIFVGILCAYFVSRVTSEADSYLQVFRVAGTAAFMAYGIGFIQDSVWFGKPWSITAKNMLDAFIYGLLTGGAFGWLA